MNCKYLAEQALIYCAADLYRQNCDQGRLRNRLNKIARLVDIKSMLQRPQAERERAAFMVYKFSTDMGWFGKDKHIGTVASFCLDLIEQSEFKHHPEITLAFNDIIEYLWRDGAMPDTACEHAAVAGEKWRVLSNELGVDNA